MRWTAQILLKGWLAAQISGALSASGLQLSSSTCSVSLAEGFLLFALPGTVHIWLWLTILMIKIPAYFSLGLCWSCLKVLFLLTISQYLLSLSSQALILKYQYQKINIFLYKYQLWAPSQNLLPENSVFDTIIGEDYRGVFWFYSIFKNWLLLGIF